MGNYPIRRRRKVKKAPLGKSLGVFQKKKFSGGRGVKRATKQMTGPQGVRKLQKQGTLGRRSSETFGSRR